MHPVLFHLHTPWGQHPVYAYGVMLGLAVIVGWYAVHRMARRLGIDDATIEDSYAASIVAALVGGRVFFVIANRHEFASFGEMISPSHGGLLAPGAWLAGTLAVVVIARRRGERALRIADAATPALALALGLTRIGCYLYGCDYGRRLSPDAPGWLASLGRFPRISDPNDPEVVLGSPVFLEQMTNAASGLGIDARSSLPVHPTQLYEALIGFVVLGVAVGIVLHAQRTSRTLTPGDVFLPTVLAYGLLRLVIEPFRGDPERGFIGPVSVPVITTVALILVTIGTAVFLRRQKNTAESSA
jgi:phosphatidylglycerol:prolipoprotein diacylglycerol transferase